MPTMLVFGARRLGGAILDRFADLGWNVAGVSLSEETARAVRERHPGALMLAADLSRSRDVEHVVEETVRRFGGIDAAVNVVSPHGRGVVTSGALTDLAADAIQPYTKTLLPNVFYFFGVVGREMAQRGGGCLIQVTGGSARRAMPSRGPWAGAAAATRAMAHTAAQELRGSRVHVAVLIVDALIASDKTAEQLAGQPEDCSTTHDDVVAAVEFLVGQSPRGWTHELTITPMGDRWLP